MGIGNYRIESQAESLCPGRAHSGILLLTMVGGTDRLLGLAMIAKPTSATAGGPGFRVGDERLIKLTANAASKVGSLLTRQGRPTGVLRVAVVGGGCSGLQYKMDLQDGPANRDIMVETGGVRVVVDPKSALYVTGSELDFVDALDGGFKVKNPNAATSCSCGESFSA
jgi:iron-sulfur cluster assembly accessory protein